MSQRGRGLYAILVFVAPLIALPAAAALPVERMKAITVMLNTSDGAGLSSCSAGIILSQSPERTLILTARHVRVKVAEELRERDGAFDIVPFLGKLETTVEFGWLPGQTYPALPVPYSDDADLDFMLMSVDGKVAPRIPSPDIFSVLGPVEDEKGQPVSIIEMGNPACRRWDQSATPKAIIEKSMAMIKAEGTINEEGLSGGALFSSEGALVGMIQRTGSGAVYARPMPLLIDEVKRRAFRVDLALAAKFEPVKAVVDPSATYAAKYDKTKLRLKNMGAIGDGFRLGLSPGFFGALEEVRFSGVSDKIVRRNSNPLSVDVSVQGALNEALYVTLIFRDGSRLNSLPLDMKTPVLNLIDALEKEPKRWASCEEKTRRCYFRFDDTARRLIKGVDVGFEQARLGYSLAPNGQADMPRGVTDLVSGENLTIPIGKSALWYKVVFADNRLASVQKLLQVTADCGQNDSCRTEGVFELKPVTPDAPPISFKFKAFRTLDGQDLFTTVLPPALAKMTGEIDSDGRGFLPLSQLVNDAADRLSFRFTKPDGTRLGPYTYVADLKTPAVLQATSSLSFKCGVDWNTGTNYCFVHNIQALHAVKEVRFGTEPGKWLVTLKPKVTAEQVADRTWRKSVACYTAVHQPHCLATWQAAWAIAPIPKPFDDLYVEVLWRDGRKDEVVRLPETSLR